MGTRPTTSSKVCPELTTSSVDRRYLPAIVMTALTNFANVTLSSLYFDITKDVLYANSVLSVERRAVVDTLERVSQLFEA